MRHFLHQDGICSGPSLGVFEGLGSALTALFRQTISIVKFL
jgi:hypothetical protein